MADRPEARRLHARQGRPAAPRDGQEEERGARRRVRRLRGGHARAAASAPAAIKALWDVLVPFSDYAFNKAHTAAYGLVSYWTAYLKANYPAEYMAALLTSVRDDKDKSALYLNECRRHGHQGAAAGRQRVRRPTSPPVGTDIRFGLAAIRNVGANVVDGDRRGPRRTRAASPRSRTSCARSPAVVCNKRTIESLIKAGAFDDLGHTRARARRRARGRTSTPFVDDQAQGGHRPGLPLRRLRRRRDPTLVDVRGPAADPDGRVGQADAAGLRARDARALRLRPPALRRRARPRPGTPTPRSPR